MKTTMRKFSLGSLLAREPDDAKVLIDRVKNCTNLLVITAWDELSAQQNATALNTVCEYAVNAKLHFIVFFSFISQSIYYWHMKWLKNATEKFGKYFLGVYFYDEPGGKLIDTGKWRGCVQTLPAIVRRRTGTLTVLDPALACAY